MRTHKLKAVLIIACVLALGAGVFAGMVVSRLPGTATTPTPVISATDHSPLSDELQLTPEQRDKMRVIWLGVRDTAHQSFDKAQIVQKERDDAVVAMLNNEQKAKYAAVTQHAAEQFAALNAQREKAFQDGVDRTKQILGEEQRKKYDEIIRTRVGPDHGSPDAHAGALSPAS